MTSLAKLLPTTIFFVVAGYLCLVYVNKITIYPQITPESKRIETTFDEPKIRHIAFDGPQIRLNTFHESQQISQTESHQNIIETVDEIPVIVPDVTETIQAIERHPADGISFNSSQSRKPTPPSVNWEDASRLERLGPRIFAEKPGDFLPQYRNPCWISNSSMYCLPYFYLAGMPKCGTTDLWFKINQHPFIANCTKEPHWWTRGRIDKKFRNSTNIVPPDEYYIRWFLALKVAANMTGVDKRQLIVGDFSASTFWDNSRWRKFYPHHKEGPPHTISEVIAAVQPESKIIVTLRNPVDRLYSDYLFFSKNITKNAQDFHSRVVNSLQRWQDCLRDHDVRTCAYSPVETRFCCIEKSPVVRLHTGMYSVYMRDWLNVVRRDQLLVLRLGDWRDDCPKTLNSIYSFLNLDTLTGRQLYNICKQEPLNKRTAEKGPMLDETRQLLDHFYDPFNNELAELLKNDAYLWR